MMHEHPVLELWQRRDLLLIIAWREVKVKYKQSVMGMLWAVLMPIVIVCSGFVFRYAMSAISGKPVETNDLLAVAVKAAPWAFFVNSLRFGTTSLVNNAHLVTKIYLPRLIFPLAAVSSQMLDFAIASCGVMVFLVFMGVTPSVELVWLPLLLGALFLLATSFAILFSAASLFFRDVKFIVDVFLTFAIFFTPVYYESAMFGKWAPLMLANPVAPLLEGLAAVVVHQTAPPLPWIAYSIGVSVAMFAISLTTFRSLEPYFAESI
ncbi:MAG TPA: ABC transporter permease [Myxococcota bacterium]|nr:ABC transporter permease [Myxococcota bacterium]